MMGISTLGLGTNRVLTYPWNLPCIGIPVSEKDNCHLFVPAQNLEVSPDLVAFLKPFTHDAWPPTTVLSG